MVHVEGKDDSMVANNGKCSAQPKVACYQRNARIVKSTQSGRRKVWPTTAVLVVASTFTAPSAR